MGFRCLRQRRARRGSPAAPGGAMLDAMYLRCPGYATTPSASCGRCSEGAVGAALRFLQVPSAVRRKNRLSARVETFSGAAGGARTRGLLFPKQARFQLRYSDMERAEVMNFFRASAMAMADKHPFASGCPHEKGPRSVVGPCPSAGPLPGDLPASGRGVLSGLHGSQRKSRRQGLSPPPAAFTGTLYHARNMTFNDIFTGPARPPPGDGAGTPAAAPGDGRRRSSPTAGPGCTAG